MGARVQTLRVELHPGQLVLDAVRGALRQVSDTRSNVHAMWSGSEPFVASLILDALEGLGGYESKNGTYPSGARRSSANVVRSVNRGWRVDLRLRDVQPWSSVTAAEQGAATQWAAHFVDRRYTLIEENDMEFQDVKYRKVPAGEETQLRSAISLDEDAALWVGPTDENGKFFYLTAWDDTARLHSVVNGIRSCTNQWPGVVPEFKAGKLVGFKLSR